MKSLYQIDIHRAEEDPLWSYFGQDIPHHKMTKIEHIRCFTYFGPVMSDVHLETGKTSLKTYFLDYD